MRRRGRSGPGTIVRYPSVHDTPRDAAPAASPAHAASPTWSRMAATVRHVAAARAAAALRATPLAAPGRAFAIRRARRDSTVVHALVARRQFPAICNG